MTNAINIKKLAIWCLAAIALAGMAVLAAAQPAYAHEVTAASADMGVEATNTQTIYRLYNRWSGEHLYTNNKSEYDKLGTIAWKQEGEAWDSPTSGTPVYRLYNPYSGDHHYTTAASERDTMVKNGWKAEGTAWYSDGSGGAALYRLFNPYEQVGTHHYTSSASERDTMVKNGWVAEGVAWYGHAWTNHFATREVPKYETVGSYVCNGCGQIFYADHAYHGTPEEDADSSWTAAYKCGIHMQTCTNPRGNYPLSSGSAGGAYRQVGTTTESYVDYKVCSCCGAKKQG